MGKALVNCFDHKFYNWIFHNRAITNFITIWSWFVILFNNSRFDHWKFLIKWDYRKILYTCWAESLWLGVHSKFYRQQFDCKKAYKCKSYNCLCFKLVNNGLNVSIYYCNQNQYTKIINIDVLSLVAYRVQSSKWLLIP